MPSSPSSTATSTPTGPATGPSRGNQSGDGDGAGAVFLAFLRLGCTSFGGPAAHLGYFRAEFVDRRQWLDARGYGDIVALCQFLPGPASSQVGFTLGLRRAGLPGAFAAWAGFTLPSALLMVGFAMAGRALSPDAPWLHGLRLVAVAVVAQAVWTMGRALCPDRQRITVALAALCLALAAPGAVGQLGAILLGAFAGQTLPAPPQAATDQDAPERPMALPRRLSAPLLSGLCLGAFAVLLALSLVPLAWPRGLAVAAAFYRSGALVFGGGHVVLPLLRGTVVAPGWIGTDRFLAGYGAVQAMPGPLFTFAAYLGTALRSWPNGVTGGALALVAIYLPSILLLLGVMPYWDLLRGRPRVRRTLAGVNAAVVGLLAAALYDPVWRSAVFSGRDFAVAATALVALLVWKLPSWLVVVAGATIGFLSL